MHEVHLYVYIHNYKKKKKRFYFPTQSNVPTYSYNILLVSYCHMLEKNLIIYVYIDGLSLVCSGTVHCSSLCDILTL